MDNGTDNLVITANGNFTFHTELNDGDNYKVTVHTQPSNPNQICDINNGSGIISGANITNVQISCTTVTYTIGGTVSNLSGSGLVLQNNSGDDLTVNDQHTFPLIGK